ncbi:hypothetical protein DY000_02017405 [Brassica cretica]|uniref:FBD domain-containing protein n=1 Tax=Brassica cretica TaxID=69181 RepID=A0ABQ7D980_BRACR|nr:hypothetical protein DY000_02017405 [Brassica cretica]
MDIWVDDNTRKFTITVPSLQRLSLFIPFDYGIDGLVIKTPSLKYFKLRVHSSSNHYCLVEHMPNLIEAYLDVEFPNIKSLIESITSVKCLEICSEVLYEEGIVFSQLEHLKLCRCRDCTSNLLVRLLKDFPNLRVLDLYEMIDHYYCSTIPWNPPTCVWLLLLDHLKGNERGLSVEATSTLLDYGCLSEAMEWRQRWFATQRHKITLYCLRWFSLRNSFPKVLYEEGIVFSQLEHLKLCRCKDCTSNLLVRLLKDSPNLRVLNLYEMIDHYYCGIIPWNPPSTVPACMLSSLQILNWSAYSGVPGERDLAIYMLKNASHLKTATILSDECDIPELEMLKELAFSSRASTTCEFMFD